VAALLRKFGLSWPLWRATTSVAIVGLTLGSVATPTLRADPPSEVTVKAAFVASLLKFVEWPATAPGTPLVLALVGDAPIGAALLDSTLGLQIGGRPVHVRIVKSLNELDDAQAVFISAGRQRQLPAILRQLDRKAVLTIGDTKGFAASGVMLNLVTQDNKVRMEANTAAAARAGLRVSSHLLRLTRIVG
jgi:hypothetical protein